MLFHAPTLLLLFSRSNAMASKPVVPARSRLHIANEHMHPSINTSVNQMNIIASATACVCKASTLLPLRSQFFHPAIVTRFTQSSWYVPLPLCYNASAWNMI